MGTFKEQIMQDIDDVFADLDEFFEEHTVNGKKMPVMVDENENLNRTKFQKALHEGVQAKNIMVYIKASDFGKLPKYASKIVIDDAAFRVTDAVNECGMYSITLETAAPYPA